MKTEQVFVERAVKPDSMSGKNMKEKAKALDNVLGQIEKQFGKGAIMRLGDEPQAEM